MSVITLVYSNRRNIGIYGCPYCGRIVKKERIGYSRSGPKLERCPYCSNIYKSGRKLYSDLSKEEVNKYKVKKYVVALIGVGVSAVSAQLAFKNITDQKLYFLFFTLSVFSFFAGIEYFVRTLMRKRYKIENMKTNDLQLLEFEKQLSAEMKQRELQGITDSEKNLMEYSGSAFSPIIFVGKAYLNQERKIRLGDTITETQAKLKKIL